MSSGQFKKGNPGRPKGSKNKPKRAFLALSDLYQSLVGSFRDGMYYVYAHFDGEECIYIGKGMGNRAWEANASARNETWWYRHLDAQSRGTYEVRIIAAQLTEDEALAIKRELIHIRKPSCNIVASRQ